MTPQPSRQKVSRHPGRLGAFAILTPPGRGGIAVIRCIGYVAQAALLRCFRPPAGRKGTGHAAGALPAPGTLAYGHILDADGQPLDEIILHNATQQPGVPETSGMGGMPTRRCVGMGTCQDRPHPDTRPTPVFEVNCHGGPAAVQAVCDRLAGLGLDAVDVDRLMELEGLPLIEREARRALRRATTPLAARILLDQLGGALAAAIGGVVDDLKAGRIDAARTALETLLARWNNCGRRLDQPPRIVIAGRPNSGKSTLLNCLVAAERAITSPVPGTTRDYVEAEAALEGAPVVLVDTAGLRETSDAVERQGVERARSELARADAVAYLVDAEAGLQPEDETALADLAGRAVVAFNKIDAYPQAPAGGSALGISALTGQGVEALAKSLMERLGWRTPAYGEAVPFTAGQAKALALAQEAVAGGRMEDAAEILAEWLR